MKIMKVRKKKKRTGTEADVVPAAGGAQSSQQLQPCGAPPAAGGRHTQPANADAAPPPTATAIVEAAHAKPRSTKKKRSAGRAPFTLKIASCTGRDRLLLGHRHLLMRQESDPIRLIGTVPCPCPPTKIVATIGNIARAAYRHQR
jgi:hypothetical protein